MQINLAVFTPMLSSLFPSTAVTFIFMAIMCARSKLGAELKVKL